MRAIHSHCVHKQSSINVSVGIQSNTTCYSFSNGVYYTSSDMFRPYHNDHFQGSILGSVENPIVIRNLRDLVSCAKLANLAHDTRSPILCITIVFTTLPSIEA
jgi:hypothetical protein